MSGTSGPEKVCDGSCVSYEQLEGGSFAAGLMTILIVAIRGALQLAG